MSNSIEKDVNTYLDSIKYSGVIANNYEAVYIGEKLRGEWEHDLWMVTFGEQSFEFKTGLGLRAKPRIGSFQTRNKKSLAVKPTPASVLYSLLLETQASQESFNDWCDNFGYDNDSIEAFNIYQSCCDNRQKLLKVFSQKQLDKFSELLVEY